MNEGIQRRHQAAVDGFGHEILLGSGGHEAEEEYLLCTA